MSPADYVSARYLSSNDSSDTELLDAMSALTCFTEWSREIGVDARTSFTDPALQQAHWDNMRAFGKKHGRFGRIRRLFGKEEASPESDLIDLFNSAKSVKSHHLDGFSSIQDFLVDSLKMLDQRSTELYAHGRLTRHKLSISRWDGTWKSYSAFLELYRYDDLALTIIVTLLSVEAFDDRQLRKVGNTTMDELEMSRRFERIP